MVRPLVLLVSLLILVPLGAQPVKVGPEVRIAQFATGTPPDDARLIGVVPSASGFTVLRLKGTDVRATALDDQARPSVQAEESVFELPAGSRHKVAATVNGALIAYSHEGTIRTAVLSETAAPQTRIALSGGSPDQLVCGAIRCLVSANGGGRHRTAILDAASGAPRAELEFPGFSTAIGHDPYGFVLASWNEPTRTARLVRILNDGTVQFEREAKPHSPVSHLVFDGERYVAISSHLALTVAMPLDLDGTLGESFPIVGGLGFPTDISWDGEHYTLLYHPIERYSIIPGPADSRIEIVRLGRGLDFFEATHNTFRLPRSHEGGRLAWNGRETILVWAWRRDDGIAHVAAVVRNGVPGDLTALTRGEVAQLRPWAITTRTGHAVMWTEAELRGAGAYRVKYARASADGIGLPHQIAMASAPQIRGVAALEHDFLVLWQDYVESGNPLVYASIIRADDTVQTIALPSRFYDRVSAGDDTWLLYQSKPNDPELLRVSSMGILSDPEVLNIPGETISGAFPRADGGMVFSTFYGQGMSRLHFRAPDGTTTATLPFRTLSRVARQENVYAILSDEYYWGYVLHQFDSWGAKISTTPIDLIPQHGYTPLLESLGPYWLISTYGNPTQVHGSAGEHIHSIPYLSPFGSVSPHGRGLIVETRLVADTTGVKREAVFAREIDARSSPRRRSVR